MKLCILFSRGKDAKTFPIRLDMLDLGFAIRIIDVATGGLDVFRLREKTIHGIGYSSNLKSLFLQMMNSGLHFGL